MDSICIHTENQTIICETCKTYICPDCVVDKFNSHRQHSLVTPKGLVDRHKKFIQDRISKLNTDIEKIDTETKELITKKKELLALDSDTMLLLSFLNTTSTQCTIHDIKSEAVCNECKVCVCIKFLIDLKCVHRDHNLSTIQDKITMLTNSNEKSINSIEKKLECLTLARIKYVNELNAVQSITVTDSEIINTYLANNKIKITDQSEITVTENSVYDLDYAINKGLKWSLKTELITENCELLLGSGYYMVIAVGGGASGGIVKCGSICHNYNSYNVSLCGGECGATEANILQIVSDTKISLDIGKGGSCKLVDNNNNKILNGTNTTATFNLEKIIAVGGKYRINDTNIERYDISNPYHHRSSWEVYSDKDNKFDIMQNNINKIDKICQIFPLIYVGSHDYMKDDICEQMAIGERGSRIGKRGRPGDAGICLANYNMINKNFKLSDPVKIKGFGSGGHGSTIYNESKKYSTYNCSGEYTDHRTSKELPGSDGTNGYVIIVYLE